MLRDVAEGQFEVNLGMFRKIIILTSYMFDVNILASSNLLDLTPGRFKRMVVHLRISV